jgi:FkbM family methyltransferase
MKQFIQRIVRSLGYEIRRRTGPDSLGSGPERASLEGSLRQVREAGFTPATVIDVGAAIGSFTRTCHSVFPNAQYLLIEPLKEYVPSLAKVVKAIPRASYEIAVAVPDEHPVMINVHPDLVGSSLYREVEEGTNVNGVPREVNAITLDGLVRERDALPPYIIKIDVQGAELDVLAGGEATLPEAEFVLMEVSLFQFFEEGPLFCDVVAYMKSKGFVPYDVLGLQYRPLDRALSQVDIAFVKETGPLRRLHHYATPEQRLEQNRQFRSYFTTLLSPGRIP